MNEIQFLNIDLDIELKDDILLVVREISKKKIVMRNDQSKGMYYASFETECSEENEIVENYINSIDSLSPEVMFFKGLRLRAMNIEYEIASECDIDTVVDFKL